MTEPTSKIGRATTARPGFRRRWPIWLACMGLAPSVDGAAAQEEASQAAIARDLRSDAAAHVADALVLYKRIPEQQRSPELKRALVDAVVRHQMGIGSQRSGELDASLVEEMLELGRSGNPVVIPALVLFPTTGQDVYETLFRFGQPGLRAVLGTLSQLESQVGVYPHGPALSALAYFVDHWGVEAFDDAIYAEIREHARKTLEFPWFSSGSGWSLGSAILLASLLDEPKLQELVADLAASSAAVRARGVSERWARDVWREAQDAVDGRLVPWWRN